MSSYPDRWAVIIRHYEACLTNHGATPPGVDWPNADDLAVRFGLMLDFVGEAGKQPELLDFGCSPGFILDYLARTGGLDRIPYHGIDLSATMKEAAQAGWPKYDFCCRDILDTPLPYRSVDFIVMNGRLTERFHSAPRPMTSLTEEF